MTEAITQIEAVLFVAGKPLSVDRIVQVTKIDEAEVVSALRMLLEKYSASSGVVLFQNGDEYQLVTHPDARAATEQFIKIEASGELTRAQLETLTVISYCGPISRPELEQVRGVNCSVILRNLMMRGLVKEKDSAETLVPMYEITMEYLRHLGIANVNELPNYTELHRHDFIEQTLHQESIPSPVTA